MKSSILAMAVLALAASTSGAEIPPGLAPEPAGVVLSQSQQEGSGFQDTTLDSVEREELARQGPGPQGGHPLTREGKTLAILGLVLLGILLIV